ncbi:GspH/FimT family pseudopilin [Rhizobacter sp. SG703]|uniref:GspH/FimT family pseudopilin n=1 Tax=Rhizobacter sp. SG703 TaxID=2587140 RepID=UPI0014465A00|nr:GspH/FimT family pseudopilin [Rhizobacter sp. SG703]NKI95016.1 type IV fimbrial biogenesis protein FimT [Rhizobacter sp. SG703]
MAAVHRSCARGMTLVELMVGLAVFAVLLLLCVPSFADWLRNVRVRSTAESLQNGLQSARAEAVRRNAVVRFQLVDTLADDCQISASGPHWAINLGAAQSPAGACATALGAGAAPNLLRVSPVVAGDAAATLSATRPVIAFDGLGRQTSTTSPASSAALLSIAVGASGQSCAPAGTTRCLKVVVSPAGEVRMCDPARSAGNTAADAMSCPSNA